MLSNLKLAKINVFVSEVNLLLTNVLGILLICIVGIKDIGSAGFAGKTNIFNPAAHSPACILS